jgi:hypothetical protein
MRAECVTNASAHSIWKLKVNNVQGRYRFGLVTLELMSPEGVEENHEKYGVRILTRFEPHTSLI